MTVVVIDTNLFVSALVAGGKPLAVLETVRNGISHLLVTEEILDEMERILRRPKFAPYFLKRGTEPQTFIQMYTALAQVVIPVKVEDCLLDDPKDIMFIECAVAGAATIIVSGDHHLLKLGRCRDVAILTPAQFLNMLQAPKNTPSETTQ
jgi:putative PIN family toxin of toxin-antitoxin system